MLGTNYLLSEKNETWQSNEFDHCSFDSDNISKNVFSTIKEWIHLH